MSHTQTVTVWPLAASSEEVALSNSSSAEDNLAFAGAAAPAASFPRPQEDKCNRKHSRKGRYSAEMNILVYINEHGENNVAELVIAVPDCRSSKEFQKNGIEAPTAGRLAGSLSRHPFIRA